MRTHTIGAAECGGQEVRLPGRSEYHVWLDADNFVTAKGDSLALFGGPHGGPERSRITHARLTPDGRSMCIDNIGGQWQASRDLAHGRLRNVTRLAVSPHGKWLAFVAEAVAPPVTKER